MTEQSPLSICMVSDDFLPGATGVGTHVQTISEHLAALGHRISIITTRRPGEPETEVWRGVRVYRVRTARIAGFDQALPSRATLNGIFDAERPDLVHQHYLGFMMLRVIRLAKHRGLRQIYTYHMTEDHLTQPWFMRPLRSLIGRQIVRSVNEMDQVISVSAGLAATLPGKGITRPVTTISNPVDFPDPAGVTPADREGRFVVLYAGRLEPEKNLSLLLRGFATFAAEAPDARLWIAGRGSQQAGLAAQAADLGIAGQVRFLGFQSRADLSARYLACDCFVLPSLVETQGLVAMEAAWFGKPVLVADSVVSARELVEDGTTGLVFDHTRDDDLAQRLRLMNASADLRESMGRAAQVRASRWGIAAVLPQLTGLYRGRAMEDRCRLPLHISLDASSPHKPSL